MDATDVSTVVDKVAGLLEKMAGKIGVAADKVWPWLVKQQYIEGATSVVTFGVLFVLSVFCAKKFAVWMGESTVRGRDEDFSVHDEKENRIMLYRVVWGVGGAVAVIATIAAFFQGVTALQQLINPEYFALMDLLKAAK